MLRTHTCGELRLEHVGQQVTLCGWVDTYRDHSGVLFVDLRDRYGKTQVVFAPESGDETLQASKALRSEYVVLVRGKVAPRPEGTVNPKLETGQIELRAEHLEILNRSLNPPFQPTGKDLPGEDIRLKYRYIDLRRPEMQRTIVLRNRMIKIMRDYCDALGFIDVETPMLGRSTPEGARDYLVPSRIQQGSFYALPQSPQLYKQILMVAGYDRYVQVAKLLPRRGPPRRSPAGVHAVGPRNVVHYRRRHHRRHRRTGGSTGQGDFGARRAAAAGADVLR